VTASDWELFQDWCDATGNVALPTTWETVTAFLEDTQAAPSTAVRRLGAIRARHERARRDLVGAPPRPPVPVPWRTPGDPVDPDRQDGPRWLDLAEALHQVPVYGWPHAVTGRRDALVLVLAAYGWHRHQIVSLTPAQVTLEPVPAIDGVDLPMTNHGLTCPSCVLTRWLRVLSSIYATGDPNTDLIAHLVEDQPADVRVHECGRTVPAGWRAPPWILPSIDGHGRIDLGTQIPIRRVSAILANRQKPFGVIASAPTDAQHRSPNTRRTAAPSLAERAAAAHAIDAALDDLDAALRDAEKRWRNILASIEPGHTDRP